jgi:hypothetical protein
VVLSGSANFPRCCTGTFAMSGARRKPSGRCKFGRGALQSGSGPAQCLRDVCPAGNEPGSGWLGHSCVVGVARSRIYATVVLIPVFVLAGLVIAPPSGAKAEGVGTRLNRALRIWSTFPVRAPTRPLVLLEGYVLNPAGGFPNNNSKIAFGDGAIAAPASWPSVANSGSGFPIIGAAAAFKTLTSPNSVVGSPPPLAVTNVALGSGSFLTDRGPQLLPAWLFSLSGVKSPAEVLAVVPSLVYADPTFRSGISPTQLAATVDRGDRRLVVSFPGSPGGSGPCTERYTSSVKESKHALAIAITSHANSSGAQVCALPAYTRHLTIKLAAPLGSRVVVDANSDGAAEVTPPPRG